MCDSDVIRLVANQCGGDIAGIEIAHIAKSHVYSVTFIVVDLSVYVVENEVVEHDKGAINVWEIDGEVLRPSTHARHIKREYIGADDGVEVNVGVSVVVGVGQADKFAFAIEQTAGKVVKRVAVFIGDINRDAVGANLNL